MVNSILTWTDVCEDVKEECAKFGSILDMKVPRPVGNRSAPGLGKIYIKYNTPEEAKVALQALAGRNFANRTVVVTYFDEVCIAVTTSSILC